MNRLVGVIHPWGGDREGNRRLVLPILDEITYRGDIPVFPPLMFPNLDDEVELDRATGMEMGRHLFALCREVEVHGDLTDGVMADVEFCEAAAVPLRRRGEP